MKTEVEIRNTSKLNLNSQITELYRVGSVYSKRLKKLSINKIKDLLLHFPFRYDDLSEVISLIEAKPGKAATFRGKILTIDSRRTKTGKIMTEAIFSDNTSTLKVIFFNQPHLINILREGDSLLIAGRVEFRPYLGRFIANPSFEKTQTPSSPHLRRIVPVYPETKGISSRWLRQTIKPLLKYADRFDEYLPAEIKKSLDLISLAEAIKQIHFPNSHNSLKAAIKRLAFDELFLLAVRSALLKRKLSSLKSDRIKFFKSSIVNFINKLPFRLTDAQRKATWQIIQDIDQNHPMNRLLNGDVGSGKTIVAAISAFCVALNKKQTAIMAPTEVLAFQHYQNFLKLFKNYDIEIELLTNNYHLSSKKGKLPKQSAQILTSDIIIGTHALVQKEIKFEYLALAVIDEQHRFGVKQRSQIKKNNLIKITPHLLSMTATPIPRTLSLALYGDLQISILNEIPKGRRTIKTQIISPQKRKEAYDFVRKEISLGRQAFVICPIIEKQESEGYFDFDNRKSAIDEYKKLSNTIFPELKIGLLHGKLKSSEKEKIMYLFRDKKIDILVSTSVVEVGIDIPNATIIIIEGAERFGLSQLHQLRGRVGRGEHQSYCFLFASLWAEKTRSRLNILASTNDGFKLAEADLKLRGPGEIYGTRQHGMSKLRFASLFDFELLQQAKNWAEKIVKEDPELTKNPKLRKKLSIFEKNIHLE